MAEIISSWEAGVAAEMGPLWTGYLSRVYYLRGASLGMSKGY